MQLLGRILRIVTLSLLIVSGGLSGATIAATPHHLIECSDSARHAQGVEDPSNHAHTSVAEVAADKGKASEDCVSHGCPSYFDLPKLYIHSQQQGSTALIMAADQLRLFDHPESLHRPPNT